MRYCKPSSQLGVGKVLDPREECAITALFQNKYNSYFEIFEIFILIFTEKYSSHPSSKEKNCLLQKTTAGQNEETNNLPRGFLAN